MALKDARAVLAGCLGRPNGWQAEPRPDLVAKNWLAVQKVTPQQVIAMLNACRETEYRHYPHLDDPRTEVHDFRPIIGGKRWIIKCYLLSATAMFISVHPLH